MALPRNNSPWPPKPFNEVFRDVEEWQVWWEGTSTKLQNYYMPGVVNSSGQGLIERLVNAFKQGKPEPMRMTHKRIHLPVAGDVARIMAQLMYGQPPLFVIARETETVHNDEKGIDELRTVEDTAADERQTLLDKLANNERFQSKLLAAEEGCSALGGHFMRVVWDADVVPDMPWIDFVDADRAIPEFVFGQLQAITFWSEVKGEKDVIWRHLQRYERGAITHALYKGSADNIGMVTPLNEHSLTAALAGDEETAPLVDAYGRQETGAKGLAAVYVPNRRPNPAWRYNDQTRELGYSDFSKDVIPVFVAIDEVWTSLMRDVRQGKGRMVVSENLLEVLGAGNGTAFDADREWFSPVAESIDSEGKPVIEQVQFEIRDGAHLAILDALLKEALRRIGISPMTFGIVDTVATTATEVRAHTRDTNQTVVAKRRLRTPELVDILTDLMAVYDKHFGSGVDEEDPDRELTLEEILADPEPEVEYEIEVEWPDVVGDSMEEKARTLSLLEQAGAMSLREKVAYLHDDWDDDRIDAEVAAIEAEKKAAAPVIADPFGGGESQGGEEGPESDANDSKGPDTGNDTSGE